jgi:hypothetical protein
MNIKTLLLSSVVGITSIFGGVSEAQASTCFNSSVTGGTICNTYSHSNGYGDVYTLAYGIGNVRESMVVVCKGASVVDWRSNGTMTQRGAQRLANHFCGI